MFTVPEKYRITKNHPLASDSSYGNNGAFRVPLSGMSVAWVISADGEDWEHVSVHIYTSGKDRTPTWAEMCKIKDLFWDDTDCVVQYHPPRSDYVNTHKHTLHLWRPKSGELPRPDKTLV